MKLTTGGTRGHKVRSAGGKGGRTTPFGLPTVEKSLLVSDGLDGLSGTLVVVFLHVPVHGAQLHLPSEVNIHRALLHCGVDELI